MAGTWVKTRVILYIMESGLTVTKKPGDWVEMGGQELRRRLAAGEVYHPDEGRELEALELGKHVIAVMGGDGSDVARLGKVFPGITITRCEPGDLNCVRFSHEYAFVYLPGTPINSQAIKAGLVRLMDAEEDGIEWDILACLLDDELTLAAIGTDEEQRETAEEVGTLRLPAYNVGALWIRLESTEAREALGLLYASLEAGVTPCHAFVRALFSFPLAICTLGADWVSRHGQFRR